MVRRIFTSPRPDVSALVQPISAYVSDSSIRGVLTGWRKRAAVTIQIRVAVPRAYKTTAAMNAKCFRARSVEVPCPSSMLTCATDVSVVSFPESQIQRHGRYLDYLKNHRAR